MLRVALGNRERKRSWTIHGAAQETRPIHRRVPSRVQRYSGGSGGPRGESTVPSGGKRGEDTVPSGGKRGEDTVPSGGPRGESTVPSGGPRGEDTVPSGGPRGEDTAPGGLPEDHSDLEAVKGPPALEPIDFVEVTNTQALSTYKNSRKMRRPRLFTRASHIRSFMAPPPGFEPGTRRLTAGYSTS
jgi:hypothetical protein